MRKIAKLLCTCLLLGAVIWLLGVVSDRQALAEELIRLHVVGASDSEADQRVKLQVRDAVTAALQQEMGQLEDASQAKLYLQERLGEIADIANETLEKAGFSEKVQVTLGREAFPVRHYDTFSLPSGVYQSLRITIGEGAGKNWWCVVFPSLCMGAVGEDFTDTAAGAGFSEGLSGALTGQECYQVRFYLLDLLGKVENFFLQFA